jgi:hypothetical protein
MDFSRVLPEICLVSFVSAIQLLERKLSRFVEHGWLVISCYANQLKLVGENFEFLLETFD